MLIDQPLKTKSKPDSYKTIILTVIISLIIGSLSGIGVSYLYLQDLVSNDDNNVRIENIEKVSVLQEESATIDVVKKASPSVVSIVIYKTVNTTNSFGPESFDNFFEFGWPFGYRQPIEPEPQPDQETKQPVGGGTGFIVSADGMILTNRHVVDDSEAEYEVVLADGQTFTAEILAKDTINDLAVIKIEAQDLTPLELGDSDMIEIGQTVIAIGNALSEFQNTVTKGVISGINRRVEAGDGYFTEVIEQAIQTDAAINPGNSGGPLLNVQGKVIGINTAISSQGQLVGFAIPVNEAKQVIESIQKHGQIVRPFLGVRYMMLNQRIATANDLPVDYGALIVKGRNPEDLAVVPGSPADKAGLEANDIILEVNGQKIDQNHSLARILAKHNPEDEVELKILHDGEEKTVTAVLTQRQN